MGSELSRVRRKLGPRVKEVVELLVLGYSNKQISRALDITEGTVKKHLSHVFLIYEIDTKVHLSRVRLATLIAYQKDPELVPFFNGDRASQFGYPSACDFLRSCQKDDEDKRALEMNDRNYFDVCQARSDLGKGRT